MIQLLEMLESNKEDLGVGSERFDGFAFGAASMDFSSLATTYRDHFELNPGPPLRFSTDFQI